MTSMYNLAILALDDFEHYSSTESISMGGATGVIKSILPYLKGDKIFLLGITSVKENLYREIPYRDNMIIVPVIYTPPSSSIPVRIQAFWQSRKINSILRRHNISSVYSHAEEISFWIKPGITILYHMHGGANAIVQAKNKYLRLKFIQNLWEYIRSRNIRKATKVIAIDAACFEIAKKQNAEIKTMLIPNFVDTRIFYSDKTSSSYLGQIRGEILLFVGRIEEVKGLELFADTLIEMNRREPGKWTGVIVGRGTYQPVIEKHIREKSASDQFLFTGPVFRQDELRKIYSRASILMISSFYEGIPMVILEALACQTPVMATNVGGIKALVADDIACFVNDNRDASEFADIAGKIMKNRNNTLPEVRFSSDEASVLINDILSKQPVKKELQ
jgi:glycosyltransferase involved in cell wall biosynthesis